MENRYGAQEIEQAGGNRTTGPSRGLWMMERSSFDIP
jgi:hypothetical protein